MKNRIISLYFAAITLLFYCASSCQPYDKQDCVNNTESSIYESIGWVYGNWWEIFNDPKLNALIEESLRENPTLKIAKDRIEVAKLRVGEAKAFLFPTLYFNGDSTRFVQSETGIFGSLPPNSGFPLKYTQTEINLDFEYEFDFFEKNKNQWRAARGELQAVQIEAMITRLILSLSVAESYFKLQTDLIRKNLAEDFTENRNKIAALTRQRTKKGLATNITKHFSENDLLSAREQIILRTRDIALDEHLLQSLIARNAPINAADFYTSLEDLEGVSNHVYDVYLNHLPLDLIGFRADIQASLQRIRAFGFHIKAAEALFYPNINLVALTGLQTIHLPQLLKGESLYGMWGPALHLPIFDGGLLKANLGLRKMDYQISVDEYESKLINAIRQALDAKTILVALQMQLKNAEEIRIKTYLTFSLVEKKLQKKLASNFDLFEAEVDFLSAKDHEAKLQGELMQALLNLIRTVGGGYK